MLVLLIEDEEALAAVINDYLKAEGYRPTTAIHVDSAFALLKEQSWDLVILDIMLPSQDGKTNGFDICRFIRENTNIPVIITSARVEESDKLLGFELGADDYLTKPFSPRELMARIKAILKRTQSTQEFSTDFQLISENLSVVYKHQRIELTLIEYRLLTTLFARKNTIVSRDILMQNAYTDHRVVSDRTMDSHITKLRKKLNQLSQQEWVQSVYGAGYKFSLTE
jgi:two-component system, OmpR family, response regulator BaeR